MCLSHKIYNISDVFIYALFLGLNGRGNYCFSTDFFNCFYSIWDQLLTGLSLYCVDDILEPIINQIIAS